MICSQKVILVLKIPFYYHLHHWIYTKWNLLFWALSWILFAFNRLLIFCLKLCLSMIHFHVYVNLLHVLVKIMTFSAKFDFLLSILCSWCLLWWWKICDPVGRILFLLDFNILFCMRLCVTRNNILWQINNVYCSLSYLFK